MSIAGIMERIGEGVEMVGLEIGCAAKRVELGISDLKAERKIRAAQKPSSLSEEEEVENDAIVERNMKEYLARVNRTYSKEEMDEWHRNFEKSLQEDEEEEEAIIRRNLAGYKGMGPEVMRLLGMGPFRTAKEELDKKNPQEE